MRYRISPLIAVLMLSLSSCMAYPLAADADPIPGLVRIATPTLSCDTLPMLQSLIVERQKSWEGFRAAFIAMQSKLDQFNEPPCIYERLGIIAVGDKKGDIIDLGVQKPDKADHADHIWLVHVSNPKTDFWLVWAEKIADPAACIGKCI